MAWAPDYCTSTELKSFVRIADDLDDAQVALAISAASRAIDRACNRQFGLEAAPVARYYTARWDRERNLWSIEIDDLMSESGLVVATDSDGDEGYSDSITEHRLRPRNASANGRPWTELVVLAGSTVTPVTVEDGVRVTALWGWSAVPTAIKQACLLQSSRLLSRRDSPFGVTGSPEMGGELRLLAKLDPDVEVTLAGYRRWWGAV
jgi:hypothetical protein